MPGGCDNKSPEQLAELFIQRSSEESVRVSNVLAENELRGEVQKYYAEVEKSLSNGGDDWKRLIPGRPILQKFANAANLIYHEQRSFTLQEQAKPRTIPSWKYEKSFAAFLNLHPMQHRRSLQGNVRYH